MSMRGMAMTRDDELEEKRIRQAAINAGKKFVSLRLIDHKRNRIQGAVVLTGYKVRNGITGAVEYQISESGGPLQFKEDLESGACYCQMLLDSTGHNLRFLASMLNYRFWAIEDKEVLEQVKTIAAEMAAKNANVKFVQPQPEKKLSDEELESELTRLQAEAAQRKLQKMELTTRKPVREIITAKEEAVAPKNRGGRPKKQPEPVQEPTTELTVA